MAGSGLTIGSEPDAEVEETKWKAAKLLQTAFGSCVDSSVQRTEPPKQDINSQAQNIVEQHDIRPVNSNVEGLLLALTDASKARQHHELNIGTWQQLEVGHSPRPMALGSNSWFRVLFVDNLDSFTLNIVNEFCLLGAQVFLVNGRGAKSLSSQQVLAEVSPTHVVLGPGPGRPDMSLLTMDLARRALAGTLGTPILGICLGHQALGLANDWEVIASPLGPVHGTAEEVHHDSQSIFAGLPCPMRMVRYNSLVLRPPPHTCTVNDLQVTAWDSTRTLVMGVRHTKRPIFGVQFHPESAGSHCGYQILKAFLHLERSRIQA